MGKNKHILILLFIMVMSSVFIPRTVFSALPDSPSIYISKLDFEEAEIRQIMKTLSEIGDQNIIVDNNITETCTIYLSDLTWKEAFLAVMKMNNLVAYRDGEFIKVIKTADFEAQINALNERERLTRMARPASVQVIKIHNARAEDIKTTLDPLLSIEDQPSVDLRTNSLVFTVTDSSLAVINQIIEKLDTETRQVSIEVKMVTVDSNSMSELGINWAALKDGGTATSITQTTIGEEGKLLVGKYSGTAGRVDILATLSSLIDKNKAEVISRPLVVTQDNEPATISSGQEVPVVTYDDARNTVITMFPATTELLVTPHILSEERILLDVDASRRTAEGVGVGLKINEERAQVKMITSNGETAVIGGMRQMQESKTDSGIPILQDIPLIGQVFKYTKREMKKSDLVIFITPRIVERVNTKFTQQSAE